MARKGKKEARQKRQEHVRGRAKERQSETGGNYLNVKDKTNFFKPKSDTYHLDVIPYIVSIASHPDHVDEGDEWYRRIFYVHRDIGLENRAMICPLKTVGRPCPICEERAKLLKQAGSDQEDVIKALRPKERELFNVIDLDDTRRGVQLFDMSTFLFGDLLEKHLSEGKIDNADFSELEGGKTLVCGFQDSSFGGRTFPKVWSIGFEERTEDYDEAILEKVQDLDKILIVPTYKQLEQAFYEVTGDDEEEAGGSNEEAVEETDALPPRKKRTVEEPAEETEPEPAEEPTEPETEPEPTKEPPAEKEPPAKKESKPKKETKPKKEAAPKKVEPADDPDVSECPFGGEFGVNCDGLEKCDDCDVWSQCARKKDEIEGK